MFNKLFDFFAKWFSTYSHAFNIIIIGFVKILKSILFIGSLLLIAIKTAFFILNRAFNLILDLSAGVQVDVQHDFSDYPSGLLQGLRFVNTFIPLEEFFAYTSILVILFLTLLVYRYIKSWIPFMAS